MSEIKKGTKEQNSVYKTYEKWKVKPIADERGFIPRDENGTPLEFRKVEELIETVKMEPRFAERLNMQSGNSGFRYYEI